MQSTNTRKGAENHMHNMNVHNVFPYTIETIHKVVLMCSQVECCNIPLDALHQRRQDTWSQELLALVYRT